LAEIFAWNAAHANKIARKEQFCLMSEMDADVLPESFKVHLMEQLQLVVARMKERAVISIMISVKKSFMVLLLSI
jgi:hypothetical protein